MADNLRTDTSYSTNRRTKQEMGFVVDEMMTKFKDSRRSFERRWYDNNFFDDGFHFRFLSRQQNKVVDLTDRASLYNPMRAIPKASRQIRGVANLLVSPDYIPVVYPEKIDKSKYETQQMVDENGQPIQQENPEYKQALEQSKQEAKRVGHWIHNEFEEQDLDEKLALMTILAGKHGVSYIQVWPDAIEEELCSEVYDAFDIYLAGSLIGMDRQPAVIKGTKKYISEIKANEYFDKEQVEKISPDNRHASSEIKEAYMKNRFGGEANPDSTASVIQKEAYIKEYLNEDNVERIRTQRDGDQILAEKKDGDEIIRQVFSAGNICLRDTYLPMDDYPFIDLRLEPGPMYGVPLIERFIPANKSLDLVASRVERYTHTMVTGSWSKRQGEQMTITNEAGGQILEYTATPPVQNQIAPVPGFVFNYMSFLNQIIEEQGVSTSTLGKVPAGVRANAAIESLKESEYATLVIASRRLKKTVKRIADKMIELSDSNIVTPKNVQRLDKGEPDYFDVIGASSIPKREAVGLPTPPGLTQIKKGTKVKIEVESGLAYTQEGKKAASNFIIDKMTALATAGLIPPAAVKVVVQRFLEEYQFGSTQDVMEAMDDVPMTEQQAMSMKVAMVEVMSDLQKEGVLPTSEQRIQEGKVATAEALKDTGVAGKPSPAIAQKGPSESISFKDLPPEGKAQLAAKAGIDISPESALAYESAQEELKHQRQIDLESNKAQNNILGKSFTPPGEKKRTTPAKGGKNATNR